MSKGLFLATIAVCLWASVHPASVNGTFSMNASASGSVGGQGGITAGGSVAGQGGLGGLTSGLTSTITGLTSGLGNITSTVGGVVQSVTGLVQPLTDTLTKTLGSVTDTLTKTLGSVTDSLGPTLESALGQPLKTVTGLLDTVTGSLNPSNISSGLTAALKPVLDTAIGLVNQLPSTVGCLAKTAVANITSEILKGVADTLKCANPLVKEVSNATQQVGMVVGDSVQIASGLLANLTKCATQFLNPPDVAKIIECLVGPVGQGLSQVTGVVGSTTPIVTGAVNSALGVPQCAQKVLSNGLSKANAILSDVVKCVTGKGLNVTLPNLPSIVPNFTAIAAKALATIEEITSAAVGANSPMNTLMMTVQKLQNVTATVAPAAVNGVVNNTLKGVQAALDAIKETVSGSSSPDVKACVAFAQKAVTDLAAPIVQNTLVCAQTIAPDATSLVAQAAALDIGLKTEAVKAGAMALTKCAGFALALDNAVEKCFDAALTEVKTYIMDQLNKVNKAIETANSLIEKAEKCLLNGVAQADKAGQALVAQLKQCLAGQGIQVPFENITSIIASGRAAVEKAVAGLTSSVNEANSAEAGVKGSVDLIGSLKIENAQIQGTTVASAKGSVMQLDQSLASNPNPAVKQCINSSLDRLMQLESSSSQSAAMCVNNDKAKVEALAAKAAAEKEAINNKVANASVTAQGECQASVSSIAAQNCFANFQVNFNADFSQSLDRLRNIADQTKMLVAETVDCVKNAATQASMAANDQLAMTQKCLNDQGVDVTIPRS